MKIAKPLYYTAILFIIISVAKLYSCGSDDKQSTETTQTEVAIKSSKTKSTGITKLTAEDYWGKKIMEKRGSLEGFYKQKDKTKFDIYFFDNKIQTVGLAKDGFDSPTKQVNEILDQVPEKLNEENYWGKKIKGIRGDLDGIFFIVDKASKKTSIYFYDKKIQDFGTAAMGFSGPTNQVNQLNNKLPNKLDKDNYWGKKFISKGYKLDGVFFTKDKDATHTIFFYGSEIGKLGLTSKGFGSPDKQIKEIATKFPKQYL